MLKIIFHVLIVALALVLAARLIPGIEINGLYTALLAALVLGIINIFIRPVLFILTLPLTLVTFGLFAFILNALMIMLASYLVDGFEVQGFLPALICSFFVSIASLVSDKLQSD